jgi:FixJ family two-component response regulator
MTAFGETVFLVDDDRRILGALTRLLRAAGFAVRAFDSSVDFLRDHDPAIPGCAVLDIAMSGLNGIELQRALGDAGCARPIIFLTGKGDIPTSVEAMKAGAVDFLTKPVHEHDLLAAIGQALDRDRAERRRRDGLIEMSRRLASLTRRERQVLPLLLAGRLNKQIAGELGTAEKTIKVHRARIMHKIGVRTVAELVRVTLNMGPNGQQGT